MNATRQILATKLYLPPLTITLVARPRLLAQLDAVLRRALTTVIAPAGFGKTMLVSAWVSSAMDAKAANVAWLTLDSFDDDPSQFWTSLIAALQTIDPSLGRESLSLLSSLTSSADKSLLTPLLNELAAYRALPIVLVLDDYHLINAPAIHTALTFFIHHLPPHAHLILISRNELSLHLARLRAQGQLVALRAADLRFNAQEVVRFLNDVMGLDLAAETVAALETRTEGWIAGLHLAALSMQEHTDRAAFVETLNASHHYIIDYLFEEVLQQQPAPLQNFLLETSILERLTIPLTDAVTARTDSVHALEQIERANLFLVSLDEERRWYRYHTLFAEMLRARLAQEQPAHIPELHQRASDWYAQHAAGETAMQGEAIRHALAAGDGARAMQLINAFANLLWARNELLTLRAWLASLPPNVLHAHPRQVIMLAEVLMVAGSINDVPPLLDSAIAALSRQDFPADEQAALRGEVLAVRAHVIRNAERLDEAMDLANEALTLLPESKYTARAVATLCLALTYHMQGDLAVADARYRDTIELCQAADDRYFEITTRCMHSRLLIERGKLDEAEQGFQAALQRASDRTQPLPIAGWAMIGLGTVALARNELERADDLMVRGLALARDTGLRNAVIHGMAGLTRLRLAQNDFESARLAASQFVLDTKASQLPHFMRWAAAMHARVELSSGNLSEAVRWANNFQPHADALMFTDKAGFAIFLRVLLAQAQNALARQWAMQQRARAAPHGHVETLIELHLIEAYTLVITAPRKHPPDAALVALEAALTLAASSGLIRLFLDAGKPIETLLAQWALRHAPDNALYAFVERLLETFQIQEAARTRSERTPLPAFSFESATTPSSLAVPRLIEPISERELQVLQLMAEGLSNHAIADRLFISEPTVKKHGSNIFGKLHATNRTEAVARARALGLIP